MTGPEVDYGWFFLPDGRQALLCWNAWAGTLFLRHPATGDCPLVAIKERENVEDLLAGIWDDYRDLGWLGERLWLVGATLPDWAISRQGKVDR